MSVVVYALGAVCGMFSAATLFTLSKLNEDDRVMLRSVGTAQVVFSLYMSIKLVQLFS